MECSVFTKDRSQQTIDLFRDVFTASEGQAEGEVIADFVSTLIATTAPEDLIGCIADANGTMAGCIFFSRFRVPDGQSAFILSPVAVATAVQGKGIGSQLIRYGLEQLRAARVNLVFTYGDPAYYSKVGFRQISEDVIKAPLPLSQPIGWLAQSLDGKDIPAMAGASQCVAALNNPDLW